MVVLIPGVSFNGIFRSKGMTLGTKNGILSDVGLSGGCGVGETASCALIGIVFVSGIGFVSGMIGISFGGGMPSIGSIGGDEGVSCDALFTWLFVVNDMRGIIGFDDELDDDG